MSVSVDIETEIKNDVISAPIQAVTVDRGQLKKEAEENWRVKDRKQKGRRSERPQSIVWISKGKTVEPRAVETGISDQGFLEITERPQRRRAHCDRPLPSRV